MIKRTVEVSTDGTHLSLRDRQLLIRRNGDEIGRVPLEDLGILILDSRAVSLTAAAMTAALDNGAGVVFCGADHHPSGLLLPIAGNGLLTERLRHQMEASVPLKKRIWARIVQAKIRCQASLLEPEDPAYVRLMTLSGSVRSGDPHNVEAQAGRAYWPALFADLDPEQFETPFRRKREGPPPNNLLNYGYMVLRAAVARAVCAAGLHPALGIHHRNRNNPFCVADDLMEPFRPFVDSRVVGLVEAGVSEIDKEAKRELLEVLTDPVETEGEKGPLLVAVQRTAFSLAKAFEAGAQSAGRNGKETGRTSAAEAASFLELPAPPGRE